MRIPTAFLDRKKIQRIIFSLRIGNNSDNESLLLFMKNIYEIGGLCFYLPTKIHFQLFKELKQIIDDEYLIGISHLGVEEGVSLLGKPVHQYEPKLISTIAKILPPHKSVRNFLSIQYSSEVLTQKEIDRITFDPDRFEKALSNFNPNDTKFILLNGKYGEWLLTLGRIDLIIKIVERVKEKGFSPILSGQWTTYFLPKAKQIDVAAYAVPINKKKSLFNFKKACELIKRFEKPVIALNPLADGKLLKRPKDAFLFLFDELKVIATIAEVSTIEELKRILENIKDIHSIIPPRKT